MSTTRLAAFCRQQCQQHQDEEQQHARWQFGERVKDARR
jgi:hypothetical protein